MALIAAHLNAGVILVVTVYSDRYIISLFPHLDCPSLISLTVSVDVKHHVYLLTLPACVGLADVRRGRTAIRGMQ